jgi:hypothetical protein
VANSKDFELLKKRLKCCEDIGDSWKAVKTLDRADLKRVEETR